MNRVVPIIAPLAAIGALAAVLVLGRQHATHRRAPLLTEEVASPVNIPVPVGTNPVGLAVVPSQ